ncbi:MAG: alkaline phosphatase family protein [Candidatus Micrarchaeia archaeon]|jgi:2,3-bisphosphoglycerate-independent phosphoglycerate mutase
MHYLLVVLDGAADRPSSLLSGKTPLEAAQMKNLNKIARRSLAGMMYPVGEGIAPESDSAVFSILSYSIENYTGRGPIEALGAGMHIGKNDIAMRANFATVDRKGNITSRRCHLSKREAKTLEKEINKIKVKGARIRFKATVDYRGVLIISSRKRLSSSITNVDVAYIKKGNISIAVRSKRQKIPRSKPTEKTEEAMRTARIVNEFVEKAMHVLSKSKVNEERRKKGAEEANAILLRDAGKSLPAVMPIGKKFGMDFCFITEMPVERGIAKLLRMKEVRFDNDKKGVERYKELAKAANKSIKRCDFVYVHIKGPDEPGHAGDAARKTEVLKEIDAGFFANIRPSKNVKVCVTCDHSTPCSMKAHSADPVPVIISSRSKHDTLDFNEKIDLKGSLGIFNGNELINRILVIG